MSESPFFTILTASFNKGPTLAATIDSIRSQTFQSLEHIVIDGGSIDTTIATLKNCEGTYNLKWGSEPDQGIADALNKGLQQARGTYIIVIHADDRLLEPRTLETVHALAQKEQFDILSFPVFLNDSRRGRLLLRPRQLTWWIHFKTILLHQGAFIHRRVHDRLGCYDTNFSIAMDYDFFYRSLHAGASVYFGDFSVAEMQGEGLGSNVEFLVKRLAEERAVQRKNETSLFWKAAQSSFHALYLRYKLRLRN